ncbi:STE/STE20/YSK protein kinase, partial [Aphelenchoides avenae]
MRHALAHCRRHAADGQANAYDISGLQQLSLGSYLDAFVPVDGPLDEEPPLQQEPQSLEHAQPLGSVANEELFQVIRGLPAGHTITYDRLGKGGFGKVQRGQLDIAIKIQKVYENGRYVQRMYDQCSAEIALHRELSHPHIVRFFDAYYSETDMKFYIDLEKTEGNLAELLDHNVGFIKEEHAAVVSRGMMRGLAFMHGRGLVHRDVKAKNVLLGRNCTVKLADLGMVAKDDGMGIATWGGTVSHWSPEMALMFCNDQKLLVEPQAEPHSAATDCWSLGITITEFMLGKALNDSMHPDQLAMLIASTDYADTVMSALPLGEYCANLRALTSACLKMDAYERPSMEQLLYEFPFLGLPGDH